MRAFLRVVLFAFAGPYVGLIAIGLLIGSYTLLTTGSARDFGFGPALVEPGILIVVYTVGFIPALLSGVAAIFVARWVSGWRCWLAMAALGVAVTFVCSFVLIGGGPEMLGVAQAMPAITLVTLSGGIAALVCAMLFDAVSQLGGRRPG